MSQFNPERVIELNKKLKDYAAQIHNDENFNELATVALSSYVMMAHPDERQSYAIGEFLKHLTGLGAQKVTPPAPLTTPELIPPDEVLKRAQELMKSRNNPKK
jgi:hypothetical protein